MMISFHVNKFKTKKECKTARFSFNKTLVNF